MESLLIDEWLGTADREYTADEASIALVTPSGRQIRLTDPISLRHPNGDAIEPLRI